jgi:FimV-like protein
MAENSEGGSFLEDAYTSARELITERFSSPFIFSFVASWLIFNYKVVILALTDSSEQLPVINKIDSIQCVLHSSTFTIPFINFPILLNGFLWPFLAATFYTFAYPYADYYITKFTTSRKVDIRNMRIEKEENVFYKFNDVQKIYIKHAEDEKSLRDRIERAEITEAQQSAIIKNLQEKLNEEINKKGSKAPIELKSEFSDVDTKLDLVKAYIEMDDIEGAKELLNEIMLEADTNQRRRAKRLINKLEKEKSAVKDDQKNKKIEPLVDLPSKDELDIIELLGKYHNNNIELVNLSKIKGATSLSNVDMKFAIGSLSQKGLIYQETDRDGGPAYRLTINGMKEFKNLEKPN